MKSIQRYWLNKKLHVLIELSAPFLLGVGVGIGIKAVTDRLDHLIQIVGPGE